VFVETSVWSLVLAAGSRTGNVFETLSPNSSISVPMADAHVSETWIRTRSSQQRPPQEFDAFNQIWSALALETKKTT
jgi:hypothetical protein